MKPLREILTDRLPVEAAIGEPSHIKHARIPRAFAVGGLSAVIGIWATLIGSNYDVPGISSQDEPHVSQLHPEEEGVPPQRIIDFDKKPEEQNIVISDKLATSGRPTIIPFTPTESDPAPSEKTYREIAQAIVRINQENSHGEVTLGYAPEDVGVYFLPNPATDYSGQLQVVESAGLFFDQYSPEDIRISQSVLQSVDERLNDPSVWAPVERVPGFTFLLNEPRPGLNIPVNASQLAAMQNLLYIPGSDYEDNLKAILYPELNGTEKDAAFFIYNAYPEEEIQGSKQDLKSNGTRPVCSVNEIHPSYTYYEQVNNHSPNKLFISAGVISIAAGISLIGLRMAKSQLRTSGRFSMPTAEAIEKMRSGSGEVDPLKVFAYAQFLQSEINNPPPSPSQSRRKILGRTAASLFVIPAVFATQAINDGRTNTDTLPAAEITNMTTLSELSEKHRTPDRCGPEDSVLVITSDSQDDIPSIDINILMD